MVLNRGNGGEIKSLDPHFIDGSERSPASKAIC